MWHIRKWLERFFIQQKQISVLLAGGRNTWDKEACDSSKTVDVLASMHEIDVDNIGKTGHSAEANTIPYCIFYDPRVKAAVTNCGVPKVNSYYKYNRPAIIQSSMALPDSVKFGIDTHGYVAAIGPRTLFISQGTTHQWSKVHPEYVR